MSETDCKTRDNARANPMREFRKQLNREAHAALVEIEREYVQIVPKQIRADLADRYEQHAHDALDRAIQALPEAGYTDAINGAVKSTDRMRLLREQSTSISATATMSVDEKRAKLRELLQDRARDTAIDTAPTHAHIDSNAPAPAREQKGPGGEGAGTRDSEDGSVVPLAPG